MCFTSCMRHSALFRMFGSAVCAVGIISAAFGVGYGEARAAAASNKSAVHVQPQPRLSKKARAEAVASLLKQLAAAQNDENAELVAAALDRLWQQSGSATADLLLDRANTALREENYDLAVKVLSALTKVAPTFAEGWHELATVHFMRDDYDNAMLELQRVLTLEPRHYKAIEGMATILRETGKKHAALKAIRKVLAIYPRLKTAIQAETELSREVEGQKL